MSDSANGNKPHDPNHYKQGSVEVIDIIREVLTQCYTPQEGYYLGNVLKYLCRYRFKGGLEDLQKAEVYLAWLIKQVEGAPDE